MYAVTTRDDAKHVSRIRQGSTQRAATLGDNALQAAHESSKEVLL
jgi:hypothetical protein